MQDSPRSKVTRSRRSCEPCRRKKVRCDGQRPACSFCRRLKQECTYKNRQGDIILNGTTPPKSSAGTGESTERIQALESRVEDLYGLLQNREAETITNAVALLDPVDAAASLISPDLNNSDCVHEQNKSIGRAIIGSFNLQGEQCCLVNEATKIYIDRIHGQPLLLFEPSKMAARMESWPAYLVDILFVSVSRWSHDNIARTVNPNRSAHLTKIRQEIMLNAMEMSMHVEILQALCLLILEEISDSRTKEAWMSIAVGARLCCMSTLVPSSMNSSDWHRAIRSLHILDSIYCSSLGMAPALPKDFRIPPILLANHQPSPIESMLPSKSQQPVQERTQKSCINDCYSAILSVWSDALDLLRVGEKNRLPSPWSDESPYRRVVAKLYNFETDLLQIHRVRHMRPDLRTANDLQDARPYWSTWFSVQILFHAVQAMINHPVLHVAGISRSQHRRPPSFLQHTVDELFQHSGWVKKLIDLGAEKDFTFNDPFIAHVTAIVATGWMFFINSDDEPLAKQAELGFEACYTFVASFTSRWPHLKHNIQKLNLLRESINTEASASAPSIQASLLWSLFDYSSSTASTSAYETKRSSRLELGVATQYLSTSDSVQTPRVDERGRAQFNDLEEGSFEAYNMPGQTDIPPENDLSLFDAALFAGFQPSNFGDDFFADFGQL